MPVVVQNDPKTKSCYLSEAEAFIIYETGVFVGNFEVYPYKSEEDAISASKGWWGNWIAYKYNFRDDFDLKSDWSVVTLMKQGDSKDAKYIKSYVSDRKYMEMEAANFLQSYQQAMFDQNK
jgi:hypothetical protein